MGIVPTAISDSVIYFPPNQPRFFGGGSQSINPKLRKGKWEMRIRKLIAPLVATVLLAGLSAHAQDSNTNTTELIQQLLKKIDALEQKVQALEQRQSSQTNNAQQIRDLGQQVKDLERNRELESEAAAAKAKETP